MWICLYQFLTQITSFILLSFLIFGVIPSFSRVHFAKAEIRCQFFPGPWILLCVRENEHKRGLTMLET